MQAKQQQQKKRIHNPNRNDRGLEMKNKMTKEEEEENKIHLEARAQGTKAWLSCCRSVVFPIELNI